MVVLRVGGFSESPARWDGVAMYLDIASWTRSVLGERELSLH